MSNKRFKYSRSLSEIMNIYSADTIHVTPRIEEKQRRPPLKHSTARTIDTDDKILAKKYRRIVHIYTKTDKEKRIDQFTKRYANVRMTFKEEEELKNFEEVSAKFRKSERAIEELRKSRSLFEKERYRRMFRQHVTAKMLEYEREDRETFGLPLLLPEKSMSEVQKPKTNLKDKANEEDRLLRIARQHHEQLFTLCVWPNVYDNYSQSLRLKYKT